MSKPRILRIVNRFNLGGPTYNACYLTKYLEDEFETLLIGGEKTNSEESSLFIAGKLGIEPNIIPGMSRSVGFLNEFKAYNHISSIIRKFKPDIVHTHASKAGALGRVAAKRNGVKHIIHTFHGHVFEHYFGPLRSKLVIKTERKLARSASAIVAISEKQRQDLVNRFKICEAEKVRVIPLGFELEKFRLSKPKKRDVFREKMGIDRKEIALGILGRLAPVKNHQLFLNAFSELKKRNLPVRGIIVGDGEERTMLEKLASRLSLSINGTHPDLIFTSWIREVDEILPGLDIVVLTSLNEGTPVSLIEAQAAGIPVISSNVGGVEDVVVEKQSGLLFPTGEKDTLVNCISELISDPGKRNQFGQAGESFVFENFTVERLVKDMKKLYFELLEL